MNTLPKRALLSGSGEAGFRDIASAHVECHFLAS